MTKSILPLRSNRLSGLLTALSLMGCMIAWGTVSAAVVINVDINGGANYPSVPTFDTYADQGAYTTADAHLWNGFNLTPANPYNQSNITAPITSQALFDSAGNSTAVQLTLGGNPAVTNSWGTYNYAYALPSYATGNSLIDDVALSAAGGTLTGQFQILNLSPNTIYSVYLYGDGAKDPEPVTFQIGGVDKSVTGRNTVPVGWTDGVDYALYSTVTSDGSGVITGYWGATNTSKNGHFAGLQIVAVPEPQTWALAALGVSAVVFRLRRKQRSA